MEEGTIEQQGETRGASRSLRAAERQALFEQFLKCIDREENLIHYRLTWGLQWNLACVASVIALQNIESIKDVRLYIYGIVAFIAAIVSFLSFVGVHAAHKQTNYLIKEIEERLKIGQSSDGVDAWKNSEFIRPFGVKDTVHKNARRISFFVPIVFVFMWIVTLLYVWRKI